LGDWKERAQWQREWYSFGGQKEGWKHHPCVISETWVKVEVTSKDRDLKFLLLVSVALNQSILESLVIFNAALMALRGFPDESHTTE
jgi:hypothetical protein